MVRSLRMVFMALMVFVPCIAGSGPALSADTADTSVAISVGAELDGGTLHIRGTATVPDHAWIIYGVYVVADPQRRIVGYAQVSEGRFAALADVTAWPAGEIEVDAHFQIRLPARKQPKSVIARYGPNGERMHGEAVVQGGGGFRAAVASTTVTKPR